MKNKLLVSLACLMLQVCVNAQQTVGWEWATASKDGVSGQSGLGITADTKGNTYEIGFSGSPKLSFGNITSIGGNGFYIVKHDASQNPLWIKRLPEGGASIRITSDAFDNFYIISYLNDTIIFGPDTLINSFPNEQVVLKYNSNGDPVWGKKINASYLASDASGNLYATGNTNKQMTPTFENFNLFLQKYTPDGTLLWTKLSGRTEKGNVKGITVNATNVCVLGSFHKDIPVFSDSLGSDTLIDPASAREDFIAKFDLNGTEQWTKRMGSSNKTLSGITFDTDGDIYFAGHFAVAQIVVGGVTVNNGGATNEMYVIKVNAAGTPLWGGSFAGRSNKTTTGVVVGNDKKVYVAGVIDRTAMVVLFDQAGNKTFSAYTTSGSAMNGYGSDLAGVAIDKNDHVFVTGRFTTSMNLAHFYLSSSGNQRYNNDAYIAKLGKCFTLYPQAPCYTSVDDLSRSNVIKWYPSSYPKNVVTLNFLRETNPNVFEQVGSAPVTNGVFYDTDTTLSTPFTGNPNKGSYRYKLQAVNDCGNSSPVSAEPTAPTLFIEKNENTFTVVKGYVNEYRYYLMRDDNNDGNWHIVDSAQTDSTLHIFTDHDYEAFKNTATWRIQTVFEIGCIESQAPLYSNIVPVRTVITGIDEAQLNVSVVMSPNPASDKLLIASSQFQLNAVEIYNAVGSLVYKSNHVSGNRSVVNVTDFNAGVYIVKVVTSKGIVNKKLIIQK